MDKLVFWQVVLVAVLSGGLTVLGVIVTAIITGKTESRRLQHQAKMEQVKNAHELERENSQRVHERLLAKYEELKKLYTKYYRAYQNLGIADDRDQALRNLVALNDEIQLTAPPDVTKSVGELTAAVLKYIERMKVVDKEPKKYQFDPEQVRATSQLELDLGTAEYLFLRAIRHDLRSEESLSGPMPPLDESTKEELEKRRTFFRR